MHVTDFDKLIRDGASDADLVRYFDEHVDGSRREAANAYVLNDMKIAPRQRGRRRGPLAE